MRASWAIVLWLGAFLSLGQLATGAAGILEGDDFEMRLVARDDAAQLGEDVLRAASYGNGPPPALGVDPEEGYDYSSDSAGSGDDSPFRDVTLRFHPSRALSPLDSATSPAGASVWVPALTRDSGSSPRATAVSSVPPQGAAHSSPALGEFALPSKASERAAMVTTAPPHVGRPEPSPSSARWVVALACIGALAAAIVAAYSRQRRQDALAHPVRVRILEVLSREPGLTAAEIQVRAGLARGTLRHHLQVLSRMGGISARSVGASTLYSAAGGLGSTDLPRLAALRDPTRRRLAELIEARPGLSTREAVDASGVSRVAVHKHVRRLADAAIVRVERTSVGFRLFPVRER